MTRGLPTATMESTLEAPLEFSTDLGVCRAQVDANVQHRQTQRADDALRQGLDCKQRDPTAAGVVYDPAW